MSSKRYFRRVHKETPTRFWINNPTLAQAGKALRAGAVGCTTNPSYVSKLIASPEDRAAVARQVDLLLPYEADDSLIAAKVQAMMVARLSDLFMPLYRASGGRAGLVTIQGDPCVETDAGKIIEEGIENRKLGANIVIKIPVTEPGIEAIRFFVERDIPTMATEVMSLAQTVSICEAYQAASKSSGNSPLFYVTHITGILDDHFGQLVTRGGARKLEDFTELVGGDLAITINWDGTAQVLIDQDKPVVSRIGAAVDPALVAELYAKLPDFARAYDVDGMKPGEYYDFGGVELFRNSFLKGWRLLLEFIAERRRAH
jgi:transaldolase